MRLLISVVLAWLCVGTWLAGAQTNSPSATIAGARALVGMEGRVEATLGGTTLEGKPVNDKTLLIVRVADTRPHGTLTWYDIRYIGLVPGRHDIRDYLRRKDGSDVGSLPELPVEITGLLPAQHDGVLQELVATQPRLRASYRWMLGGAAAVWLLGGVGLVVSRKRRAAPRHVRASVEPTLADRLQPLVEDAAGGRLTADGKAHLERLLVAYWCDRLQLDRADPVSALAQLRDHPEAGEIIRELEHWLHEPPGRTRVDVERLLAPYRRTAAAERLSPGDALAGKTS